MNPIVRVVKRRGHAKSASGLFYEIGTVRLRSQSILVYRGNGLESCATASPGQFPGNPNTSPIANPKSKIANPNVPL